MNPLVQFSDTQLVTIYQLDQDPSYFGELYLRYYKKVYHFCLGKLKNRNDAYDVTTDVFLKLATRITSLRNPELFVAWLFRMAHNASIDSLRAKKRMTYNMDANYYDIADDSTSMDACLYKEQQLQILDQVMEQLDAPTKQILVEKYYNGKSIQALGIEMGVSSSAVKMRLLRGREKVAAQWPVANN